MTEQSMVEKEFATAIWIDAIDAEMKSFFSAPQFGLEFLQPEVDLFIGRILHRLSEATA